MPLDVVMRRRHPHRPELVLLCDVSGSVAEFAQFTFTLVHALHDELRRVRSFAFVDGIAEVTDLFESAQHEIHVNRFVERRGVLGDDGHSDYGRALHPVRRASPRRRRVVALDGDHLRRRPHQLPPGRRRGLDELSPRRPGGCSG